MDYEMNEIDLLDLMRRICVKWKYVIVCALCGALLLNILSIPMSMKKTEEPVEQEQETAELPMDIDSVMERLTPQDKESVDRAYENYNYYVNLYHNAISYRDNSQIMKLSASSVPTLTLTFLVDNHYEVNYQGVSSKDFTSDILASLSSALVDQESLETVLNSVTGEYSTSLLLQLIRSSHSGNILTVTINALTKEDSYAIGEVLKTKILATETKLESVYGEFALRQIDSVYKEVPCDVISTLQNNHHTYISNIQNTMNGFSTNMTEDMKVYYSYLFNPDSVEKVEDIPEEESDAEAGKLSLLNMKFIVLGFLLGFVFACGHICVVYIMQKTVKTEGEIRNTYRNTCLGLLVSKKTAAEEKWIQKIFRGKEFEGSMEDKLSAVIAQIDAIARCNEYQKVYVASSAMSEEIEAVLKAFEEKLSGNVTCEMKFLDCADTLSHLQTKDCVILLEQVDVSYMADVKKEMEFCKLCKIPVVGHIVIA